MRSIVLALALFASAPSWGHDAKPEPVQAQSHDPLNCYCRAKGRIFAPGERICLGQRLVECRMEINVMSWAETESSCPES